MDEHSSNKNPKRRRRALTWGIFGLAGVIMSTAWATGFGTSNSDATGTGPAQNAFGQGAVATESISEYATAVTAQAPLAITFDGLWGQIAADTNLFEVDLSATNLDLDVRTGTFFVDIYVDNAPFISPWSAARIKWHRWDMPCADVAASDTDAVNVGTGYDDVDTVAGDSVLATAPKVMNITTADAHVSFQSIPGDAIYCFGIASTNLHDETSDDGEVLHADDEAGTFLTRPNSDAIPTAPDFTAIVNRSSNT